MLTHMTEAVCIKAQCCCTLSCKTSFALSAPWLCVENLRKHSCRMCSACAALACRLNTASYLSIHSSGSPAHDREWFSHSLKWWLKAFQSDHSCISLLCMIVTIQCIYIYIPLNKLICMHGKTETLKITKE